MLKKIFGVIAILLALVLALAATKPDTFRVERSITIKAPPGKVFAYLNDFQQFGAWSPWEKLDPGMKRTFSGPPSGVGSVYEWKGNDEVGAGRMEIVKTEQNAKVTIKLDFFTPFESQNTTDYILQSAPEGTFVTWAMFGPSPFVTKLMTIFVSMDAMVGKDFEHGLANLKAVAEK
jgi:uncharacterized protein YndB with AHSA1/START domain